MFLDVGNGVVLGHLCPSGIVSMMFHLDKPFFYFSHMRYCILYYSFFLGRLFIIGLRTFRALPPMVSESTSSHTCAPHDNGVCGW